MKFHQWLTSLVGPGRAIDRSRRRAGSAGRSVSLRGRRGVLEDLESRDLFALDIVFNYSFDTSNFFDTPAKKALLDLAATTFESRIVDNLTAITPGGVNTWDMVIANPATGALIDGTTVAALHDQSVPVSTIVVFVGSHELGGSTLGQGGFGGFNVNGTQTFVDAVQFRGQSGVGTTDFAPWGGSIAFDSTTNWFFGTTTAGILNNQSDFLSVAMHELGHVLGFGTSNSFHADRTNLNFNGSNAKNQYDAGGTSVPLADTGHWAEAIKDGGFEASMDPTVTNGTRKTFTELDFAALVDLGWTLTNHQPTLDISTSPMLSAINEDTNNNPGTLVSSLITAAGGTSLIADADAFGMKGIAVTAVDNTNGVWEYTLNNGSLWTPFNAPTATSARLLSSDPATKIRFVPAANWFGTVTGGISFRAWDQTTSTPGANGNSASGTAYSVNVETASITVNPVNDAPTNVQLAGASIAENSPNGTLVGTFSTEDADPGDTHTYVLTNDAGGRFAINGNQLVVANSALLNFEVNSSHNIQVRSTDLIGQSFTKNFTITLLNQNEIFTRRLFYNSSKFDGNGAAAGAADDVAIATDKTALLPGGTATFANYTSYSRGINGVTIDVEDLAGTPTAADFQFRTGNDNNPAGWAPAPAPTAVVVRAGAGLNGSDRIQLTWADGAIKKTWLQVTIKATAATGLTTADVFYFGNAVGETGDGANALVNASDEIQARNNARTFLNPALVDNVFDFNRDGLVNATDQILARSNSTIAATALKWITVPTNFSGLSDEAEALASAGAPASGSPLAQSAAAQILDDLVATSAVEAIAPAIGTSNADTSPSVASAGSTRAVSSTTTASAMPSNTPAATSNVELSVRGHLASRVRTDAAGTTSDSTQSLTPAVDWMARVGQYRRRVR